MGNEATFAQRRLHHGQGDSVAELKGVAGVAMTLQGIGLETYEWEAGKTRQALDLEIRAIITSTLALDGKTPVVRWYAEFGVGDNAFTYPPRRAQANLLQFQFAILPARGLVLRTSARQFRISFTGGFDIDGGDVPENTVTIGVQPSAASILRPLPYAQFAEAEELCAFPMNASEFRVREPMDGAPFSIGACTVGFLGLLDEALATADVADAGLSQWSPIPPMAASMSTDVNAALEFR
jgi:hypothetical protein